MLLRSKLQKALSFAEDKHEPVGSRQPLKQGEPSHGDLRPVLSQPDIDFQKELLDAIEAIIEAASSWKKIKDKLKASLPPGKTLHDEVTRKLLKERGFGKAEEIFRGGKLQPEVLGILDRLNDEENQKETTHEIAPFLESELARGWYISERDLQRKFNPKFIITKEDAIRSVYATYRKKFLLLPDVPNHHNIVYSVSTSPKTNLIVSGSDDCTARFWRITDNDSLRCVAAININTGINRVSLSEDGNMLAIATNDGSIQLLDVNKLTSVRQLQSKRRPAEAWAIQFGPQNTLASGGVDCAVRLWDVRTGKCHGTLKGHKQWVNGVAFPPSGRILASCSGDKTIKLWDVGEMEMVGSLTGHDNFVRGIGFARKHELVTCSDDRTVRVWNLFESVCVRQMRGHAAAVYDLSVSAKQRVVCTASQDSTLRLWNIDTGVCLSTLVGHKADVNSVQFVDNHQYVVSASDDFSVRIWKVPQHDS